eukprot:gb/GEZJ01006742.1/.p1 GENE.gb/GEZJ01006742.1/~~gb/GEZJ01006742.1/.p1  ORF type:complete len:120 (+),score=10.16 gb/GEZJ01006742.1/:91-450(+)
MKREGAPGAAPTASTVRGGAHTRGVRVEAAALVCLRSLAALRTAWAVRANARGERAPFAVAALSPCITPRRFHSRSLCVVSSYVSKPVCTTSTARYARTTTRRILTNIGNRAFKQRKTS